MSYIVVKTEISTLTSIAIRAAAQARIGTVDKFQCQEPAEAIHSLTTSDAEQTPRGLGFLLDPHRLNVAISRCQCLSIVVGSPTLSIGTPPRSMR